MATNLTVGGLLTDFATGAPIPGAGVQITKAGTISGFAGSSASPASETPADSVFGGKVDWLSSALLFSPSPFDGAITITFTNLDLDKRYSFRGTAIRGAGYSSRWTLATLVGARSAWPAHLIGPGSPGIVTNGWLPYGVAMLPITQAAWNSGHNLAGDVIGWDGIEPVSGSFSVICSNWTQMTPGGPGNTNYCYAFSAFQLSEMQTEQAPVRIVVQPQDNVRPEGTSVALGVAATGTSLLYQWHKDGLSIPGATNTLLIMPNVTFTNAGIYTVVVRNEYSSEISRDASLTIIPSRTAPLIALTNAWKYDQSGTDLGSAWKDRDYNDATWLSGPGVLAYENNPSVVPLIWTPLSLTNTSGTTNITFYFRTHFLLTNDPSTVYLVFSNLVDDGAVFYLNGIEILRQNMPTGEVFYSTFGFQPAQEGVFVVTNSFTPALVQGDNVLAVEVHQNQIASSDIVFGMALSLVFAGSGPMTVSSQPSDRVVLEGRGVLWLAVVNGSPPWFFQWYKDGLPIAGATNQAYAIQGACFDHNGSYFFTVSNRLGSATSSNAVLTVQAQAPQITSQPASRTNYMGTTATFSVGYSGCSVTTCQWYKDGLPVPGGTNLTLLLLDVQETASGAYHAVLSNMLGIGVSSSAELTVWPGPQNPAQFSATWRYNASGVDLGGAWREPGYDDASWNAGTAPLGFPVNEALPLGLSIQTPLSLTNNQGERVVTHYFRSHFTVTNNPGSLAVIPWAIIDDGAVFYLNGLEVGRLGMPPGSIGYWTYATRANDIGNNPGRVESFVIPSGILVSGDNVLAVEVHQHNLTSSDVVCAMMLKMALVPDTSLAITNHASTHLVLEGDSVVLDAGLTGYGGYCQWFKDGTPIAAGAGSILRIPSASLDVAGTYHCVASNSVNQVTSAPARVFVCVSPQNRIATEGNPASLTSIVAGPGLTHLQWLMNGVDLPGQTNAVLSFNPSRLEQTANYSVRVQADGTELIMPPGKLTVLSWVNQPFYHADFNSTVGSEWSHTSQDVTLLDHRRYLGRFGRQGVTLTISNLPPHSEINLSFDLLVIRTWDGNVNEPSSGPDVWRLAVNGALAPWQTTFLNHVQTYGQAYPGSYPECVYPARSGSAENARLGYPGLSSPYYMDTVYHLSFQMNHTSNVLVAEFEGLNPEDINNESWGLDNVVVSLANMPAGIPPLVTAAPGSQVVLVGSTAVFTVGATTTSPLSYQWRFNGTDIMAATNSYLVVTNAAPDQAGIYAVVIQNAHGTATRYATLGVVNDIQPPGQTVNAGGTAAFSVSAIGPGLTYEWRRNGQVISGATNASVLFNNLGTNHAGYYSVLVFNGGVPFLSSEAQLAVPLPGQPGSKLWEFQARAGIYSTPAIAPDGTIYVSANHDMLYALYSNGSLKWEYDLGDWTSSSPAVGRDGMVYVSTASRAHAVRPDGVGAWSLPILGGRYASPAIAANGTIYFCTLESSNVIACHTNGTIQWQYQASGRVFSSPAIAPDGTLYFGTLDTGELVALNPNGTRKWSYQTGNWVYSSPAIGADGAIVCVSQDRRVHIVNSDGTLRWGSPTMDLNSSCPAIAKDGSVLVGSMSHLLYSLGSLGDTNWVLDDVGGTYLSAAVASDGTLLCNGQAGNIYAVSTSGEESWTFVLGDNVGEWPPRSAPTIGPDSTIYVGTPAGKLYAIQGTSALAESPWPMFRRDAQHTGRMPFLITNQPASQQVWSGSPVTLQVGVSGTPPFRYQWRFNGTNIANATNTAFILASAQPANTGAYSVLVHNPLGSYASYPASLDVQVVPPTIVSQPASRTVRLDESVLFQVQATGSLPMFYQWFKDGAPVSGQTDSSLPIAKASVADSGSYVVRASNVAGITNSLPAALAVLPFTGAWSGSDVGAVGVPGGTLESNGVVTVNGSGEDITGTVDGFHFWHQTLSGDGQIVGRLLNLSATEAYAEAGVMIREGLGASARHVFLARTANGGMVFRRRLEPGDYPSENAGHVSVPCWLRLMRMGDTFVGHVSTNGANWDVAWWTTVFMSDRVEIGLAVTAHHYSRLATGVFDSVAVSELRPIPGPWLAPGPNLLLGGEATGMEIYRVGGFKFLVAGEAGGRVEVLAAPYLGGWMSLGTLTNSLGVVDFLDQSARTNSQMFYRVKTLSR